jgi:hypothetical protein
MIQKCIIDEENSNIILESILQTDFNVGKGVMGKAKKAVILSSMPASIKLWNKELIKNVFNKV